MTVADLIKHLQTYPQDLPVAYCKYSEYAALEEREIVTGQLSPMRSDGWVHDRRPGEPTQEYLIFPGN